MAEIFTHEALQGLVMVFDELPVVQVNSMPSAPPLDYSIMAMF
jgi:hypothetical protein